MFSDRVLEKIFADEEMQKIPIGCQSTAIRVIERILDEDGVVIYDTGLQQSNGLSTKFSSKHF